MAVRFTIYQFELFSEAAAQLNVSLGSLLEMLDDFSSATQTESAEEAASRVELKIHA